LVDLVKRLGICADMLVRVTAFDVEMQVITPISNAVGVRDYLLKFALFF